MTTKKDVILRKYRELKAHMTEILGEENSDILFMSDDELKIYLPKYISDFEYYFKNETKYNRFLKMLLFSKGVDIDDEQFNEAMVFITEYIDEIKDLIF